MKAFYVNHETGELYEDKNEAMEQYRNGVQIDLYSWSEVFKEYIFRGFWEV